MTEPTTEAPLPSDSEPRTEAGRALLSIGDEFRFARPEYAVREAVLAIEAEAARLALEDVAAILEDEKPKLGMNADSFDAGYAEAIRAIEFRVLALLSTKEDGS